jgi:hypothetical protein
MQLGPQDCAPSKARGRVWHVMHARSGSRRQSRPRRHASDRGRSWRICRHNLHRCRCVRLTTPRVFRPACFSAPERPPDGRSRRQHHRRRRRDRGTTRASGVAGEDEHPDRVAHVRRGQGVGLVGRARDRRAIRAPVSSWPSVNVIPCTADPLIDGGERLTGRGSASTIAVLAEACRAPRPDALMPAASSRIRCPTSPAVSVHVELPWWAIVVQWLPWVWHLCQR